MTAVEELIANTAAAIDIRFSQLQHDNSVKDAFKFILALSVGAQSDAPESLLSSIGVELGDKPATPLNLTRALSAFLNTQNSSLEYYEIARQSAAQAIAQFYSEDNVQADLFGKSDPSKIWKKASTGRGFCVLSRYFFTSLTTNYIKYFLDREASSVIDSVPKRIQFRKNIEEHIDRVARHSFETAKITQSFAAGWYNKNVKSVMPEERSYLGFLNRSLGKIRHALKREEAEI